MRATKSIGVAAMVVILSISVVGCGDKEQINATAESKTTIDISTEESKTKETTESTIEETETVETEAETIETETIETETIEAETTEAEIEPEVFADAETSQEFALGYWNDYTFINEWLNLKITFPTDSYIASAEEIEVLVGASQEMLINIGQYSETEMKVADFLTAYDMMVLLSDGSSNIQLLYENVTLASFGRGMAPEAYLDVLKPQLTAMEMGYQFGDIETVQLGSKSFVKLPASTMGGVMLQDYYCYSEGNYVVTFIVTYFSSQTTTVNRIMNGITTVR